MADENDIDDVIDAVEPEAIEPVDANDTEVEAEPEDQSVVVEIGGDDEDDDDEGRSLLNTVRRADREKLKRIKALEAELETFKGGGAAGDSAFVPLPEKPTLEGCDWDTAAFEKSLDAWHETKRAHDAREAEAKQQREKEEQRWQRKLAQYDEGKTKLGASDFEDAEAVVADIFAKPFPGLHAADVRMGLIKEGFKDSATVIYALGRNPERAKALAAIESPVEFMVAVTEFRMNMKVVRGGEKPAPERKVSGAVPGVGGAVDKTLDRLREEAAKTGDFTKVAAYKRSRRG